MDSNDFRDIDAEYDGCAIEVPVPVIVLTPEQHFGKLLRERADFVASNPAEFPPLNTSRFSEKGVFALVSVPTLLYPHQTPDSTHRLNLDITVSVAIIPVIYGVLGGALASRIIPVCLKCEPGQLHRLMSTATTVQRTDQGDRAVAGVKRAVNFRSCMHADEVGRAWNDEAISHLNMSSFTINGTRYSVCRVSLTDFTVCGQYDDYSTRVSLYRTAKRQKLRCARDYGNRGETCAHQKAVAMWLQIRLCISDDVFSMQYLSAKLDDNDDEEECLGPELPRFFPASSRDLDDRFRKILTDYVSGTRVYPLVFEPAEKVRCIRYL